ILFASAMHPVLRRNASGWPARARTPESASRRGLAGWGVLNPLDGSGWVQAVTSKTAHYRKGKQEELLIF
ncbi:MAG: hypothetical protein ACREA0_28750, partial [bacterium]